MVPRLWREQALGKDDGECRQRRCRLRRRVSAGQASTAEGRNQVVGHQGERSDAAVFVVVAAAARVSALVCGFAGRWGMLPPVERSGSRSASSTLLLLRLRGCS